MRVVGSGLVAVVLASSIACGAQPEQQVGGSPSFVPVTDVPDDAHALRVRAGEFFFDPAGPTVPAGREVALTLQNIGEVEHDWLALTQDDQAIVDAYVYVDAGETATGVFTLDAGTYTVICTIPGHRAAGMEGTVTAE